MKAFLVFWHKDRRQYGVVLELKIHEVEVSIQYPDGLKYRLICKDLASRRFLLMDNHHPKGHHIHLDDREIIYLFRGLDPLIDDFKGLVLMHLGIKI